ncbi:MAG: hypothetical protein J6A15_00185 [Clostridia bacterium]|nr:hypothetical protein [Clostridia bacterium]
MEIIKRGTKTLPEDKIYIGKCHTCGCKFTYNECDTTYKVVKCPQCEYLVVVPFIRKRYKGGKRESTK